MNYDDIVRSISLGEKIYNLPLRVTYYARVSTESDIQLNSLENQFSYYEKYIKENKKWTYVTGYVEQVSGVRVDKRSSFKQMIIDAKKNKFDLIITKEVSRFARDLEDSIHYIRKLKEYGVGVFFENQGMDTFDTNSELTLNMLFNIAQEESKKLSSRIKFGHKRAIEKGHVLGSSNIIGYKKDKCKLVIVEEEAQFIRKVFELYSTGEYGFYKLAKKLGYLGYINKKGKIYDKSTLKRIIENPKYKGYYRGHTFEIMDYRTKRRKLIPNEEQIIYKCDDDIVPAIVSEKLWDKANKILELRTFGYKNNNWSGGLKYSFSSKIYCYEHNVNFQRSHGSKKKNKPTWSCGEYIKYGLDTCVSPIIYENDLYYIFNKIMDNIIFDKNTIIENLLKIYNDIDKTDEYDKQLFNIDKDINCIEDKKNMLLNLVFDGTLTKSELKYQFKSLETQIDCLIKKRKIILKQIELLKKFSNSNKIKCYIEEELNENLLDSFIRKFLDEIIVHKIDNDRYNIHMDIFLNLLGEDKPKIKGARNINGLDKDYNLYLENCVYDNSCNKRKNSFTYNVYVESF